MAIKKSIGTCCAALFYLSTHFVAQNSVGLNIKSNWQAQWICPPSPDDTLQNTWLCWRKTVDFSETQPPSSRLHKESSRAVSALISVDSKYWLYINGKLVIREGQVKRGPTPADTYYDSLDISQFLKKGKNTIAILHWYFGKHGFSHISSGRAGLLFELSSPNPLLAASLKRAGSSTDWKVMKHPAFLSESPSPHPNYRLSESNIHFDARLDRSDWFSTIYDDSNWANAIELGHKSKAIWGNTWRRTIPFWRDADLKSYPSVSRRFGDTQDTIIAKLPRNLLIYPYLKVKATGGERIEIRTDNYKGGGAYNVRADYICRVGVQEFEVLGFQNGHEVWYIVPKTLEVLSLKYRQTGYDTEGVGYFQSSDDFLNKLWEKSRNTLDISLRDNYMDCPDRERAQWWGDAVLQMSETFYAYDRRVDALSRKAISNFLEWQKPNSVLFAPVPAGNWDKELPGQSLATVWGIKNYFDTLGDSAILEYAYPFVKKYMALWQTDSTDLVIHRAGGWSWHDWGADVDVPVLDNVWYYRALESLVKMAEICGDTEGVIFSKLKREKLKIAFQKQFWQGKAFVSPQYPKAADDRANGLAVVAGLSDSAQWASIKSLLDTTFQAGPYLEKYILEAYFLNRDAQGGLNRMKKRYRAMVQSPLTTLWEGWEIGSATYGGGTYNHGWTGGPLTLMSRYIGGLSYSDKGFELYPQVADLEWFRLGASTVNGFVRVVWKRKKGKACLTIHASKSKGIIGLPKNFPFSKIEVNGQLVWQNGKLVKNIEGLVFLNEDNHTVCFLIAKNGTHRFEMK